MVAGSTAGALLFGGVVGTAPATAAQSDPGLGTAESFAVLAGQTVTNTGPSAIFGDLGVSPQEAVTGFPPGEVKNGVVHAGDATAEQALADLTTAYNDAAGRGPAKAVDNNIGGETLPAGVYQHDSGMFLGGTVTLDAQNDPKAVFIFQAGSTLTTASSSTVALINGAQPCNVYWQVGSSATLGTETNFVGTVMALTSATLDTGADVEGRILARNGAVTLDTNTISLPGCDETVATPSPSPSSTPGTKDGAGRIGDIPGGIGDIPGGIGDIPGGTGDTPGGTGDIPGATLDTIGRGPGGAPDTSTGGSGSGSGSGGDTPGGPRVPSGHPRTGLGGAS